MPNPRPSPLRAAAPWFAALALAACAWLPGAPWRLSPAQAAPPTQQVWEYRVFRMAPADYQNKADYLAIKRKAGKGVEAAFTEHVLNYLGKEGWELVQAERRNPNLLYLYLRRPKQGT